MLTESSLLQNFVSEYLGLLDDCINEHLQKSFKCLMNFSSNIKNYLLKKFFDFNGNNEDHLKKFKYTSLAVKNFLQESQAKEQSFLYKIEIQLLDGNIPVKQEKQEVLQKSTCSGFLTGIPIHIIQKCLASKSTAIEFFVQKLGLYLPIKKDCHISYIRGLLEGTKKAFKQIEMNEIHVPFYEEFQVDKSWKQMQRDEKFMLYMPYKVEDRPNRQFFYNIYNTLYPNRLQDLITKAYLTRNLDFEDLKKNVSQQKSKSKSPSLEKPKSTKYFCQITSMKERKQHDRKRNQIPEINFLPIDEKKYEND